VEIIVRHMDWGELSPAQRAARLVDDGCIGFTLTVKANREKAHGMTAALREAGFLYDRTKLHMSVFPTATGLASVELEYDYPPNTECGQIESQEFMAP